ncbi:MAG: hypothetical protein WC881_01735 [Elusimicrobiota bacterium]|jgi:hypothetical protein
MDAPLFQDLLKRIEIVRAPGRALSTFGATRLTYHLISPIDELKDRTRLRRGTVLSEKPKILTPDAFKERFQGFGRGAKEFAQWLTPAYQDLLRALEYNFKNQDLRTRVVSGTPQEVAERVKADLDRQGAQDQAVIRCPDAAWSLALMKFTLDHTARSFPVQVRDLDRRGLFDPAGKEADRRRREVESLLAAARTDHSGVQALGRKLREYGLFEEYEDRFLSLF